MKSTVEQLSLGEQKALALFYDSEAYKALKHLCKLEIEGFGKDALASPSHEQTRYYSGQANMAAKLIKLVDELYKEYDRRKDAKQKS